MNNNDKFLVAKMGEREKTIAIMKASLYSTSIDNLIIQAIDNYVGSIKNMTCVYCQEETVVSKKKVKECHHDVANKKQVINVLNYPLNVCNLCDAEFDDMDVSVYTNELIRYEVLNSLRKRQPMPVELDFNELIKMVVTDDSTD